MFRSLYFIFIIAPGPYFLLVAVVIETYFHKNLSSNFLLLLFISKADKFTKIVSGF